MRYFAPETVMKLKRLMCLFLESQEEDGDIEAEEAEGEENDLRPYNLRQRKTVERYQAPPIGKMGRRKKLPNYKYLCLI